MAAATRRSLASRAGAAARRVVSRGASTEAKAAKSAARSVAKTPAKKTAAKKTTAQKSPAKKTAAAKTTAKKAAVTSTTRTATKAPAKKAAEKTVTAQTTPPAKKAPATRAPAKKAPVKKAGQSNGAAPAKLVVLEAEDPWTKAELKEVRAQLNDDVKRLTGELAEVEEDLAGMIANSGEGAGNDQADVGSASFERDQEMVIVNNARDMLEQSEHALERIADGSYGQCEICGNPIGKNRLMAFPRATLCLSCKQREERR